MNSHIIFRRQEDFTFVSIRFPGSSQRTVYDMTYKSRNCPVFWEINLDLFQLHRDKTDTYECKIFLASENNMAIHTVIGTYK
jgi:hypothetical protein